MRKHIGIKTLGITGLLLVALLAYFLFPVFNINQQSLISDSDETYDNATDFRGLYDLALNQQYFYELSQTSKISFHHDSQNKSEIHLKINGILVLKPYKKTEDAIHMALFLENTQLKVVPDEGEEYLLPDNTERSTELNKRSTLIYSKDGHLKELLVPQGIKSESAQLMRALSSMFQVSVQTSSTAPEGQGYETNNTGRYSVSYKLFKQSDRQTTIHKTKNHFVSFFNQQGQILPAVGAQHRISILPGSETTVVIDIPNKRITSVSDTDRHFISAYQLSIRSNIETSLNYIENQNGSVTTAPSSQPAEVNTEDLITWEELLNQQEKNLTLNAARQKLRGQSYHELISRLNSIDLNKEGQERFEIFEQLQAYFTLNPNELDKLKKTILDSKESEAFYLEKIAVYFGVFTGLDHPQAEQTLLEILPLVEEKPELLRQTIPAVASLKQPTDLSKNALLAIRRQPINQEAKHMSTLALGAVAHKTTETLPATSNEINRELISYYENSTDIDEKLNALSGLGNAGTIDSLDIIRQLLETGNEDERSFALFELRFIPSPEADLLLIQYLNKKEERLQFYKNGLQALTFRAPTANHVQAVWNLFNFIKEDSLKIEALRTLAIFAQQGLEDALNHLKQTAEKSENKNIRNAAERLLLTL